MVPVDLFVYSALYVMCGNLNLTQPWTSFHSFRTWSHCSSIVETILAGYCIRRKELSLTPWLIQLHHQIKNWKDGKVFLLWVWIIFKLFICIDYMSFFGERDASTFLQLSVPCAWCTYTHYQKFNHDTCKELITLVFSLVGNYWDLH